ncbi:cytochrome c-type biogenesis protein CcmH [Vibrio sp. SCSIO 43140]|uniref:cytochrome c-type biogenesis protein n=1 Tax=Vibrio sp. SCSIO 43140 TaxID=2819100 RepID=UPI0020757AC3|nr:cytochrome c-type biogenesis protein [Vibrio sp. SCSIO 43140]USD61821.1 cytochrome c-type biogenesis protein CcmH [Vibrio sp. SCSIO 43140]
MLDKLRIAISTVVLFVAVLLSASHAFATQAHSVDLFEFDTPKQQKQAIELAKTLRCPMCQNQNLIESNSPVAKDIRLRVFELVKSGQSNQQVKAYMVDRYGEHVLYQPSMSGKNILLWGMPVAFAMMLAGFMIITMRRNSRK